MNGNLPPGVSSGDRHFYPDDERLCECDHSPDEHDPEGELAGGVYSFGRCMVTDCDCEQYDPDPTDEELDRGA